MFLYRTRKRRLALQTLVAVAQQRVPASFTQPDATKQKRQPIDCR